MIPSDLPQWLQNKFADPRLFWLSISTLYVLGSIASGLKCHREGWNMQNVTQLWSMAGSAVTNLLLGFALNR